MKRIGVFGGSFNPVHLGHLIMAQDALEKFQLDRVIFVPAAIPPHKSGGDLAPADHRLEMLGLAIQDDARFEVSDMEIMRGGVSYTVDTMQRMAELHPDDQLFFIIGGDSLPELPTWREINRLMGMCEFITIARPGALPDRIDAEHVNLPAPWPEKLAKNIVVGHLMEISSTDIRARVSRNQSIRYLVPPAVAHYIQEHKVYSD